MCVPCQVELPKVVEARRNRGRVELTRERVAAEGLCDLDIQKMWNVKGQRRVRNAVGDRPAPIRAQQELDDG